ncbi:SulP family inorganic anion transporter [Arcticibacterium luteifluviistationis]|uniref:Sulfate transporter n=1 Tax=Arcticibacterium luteifluviistationis TaxID=1784714 RepID=A0A2Z4GGY9_9BACT|nr:SulP family inorganic anion transporter [Arcticibacterium luteifluviistationis]AWW00653.1 sulfate transporter [Arcticibacterium luteifluviistationis]
MSLKKVFGEDLASNIFSGLVVSLIALPLGLGLALASGAPPISGVIAAVVGGVLVSILGGSNVTITGPGNGLVVAVLAAITTLGEGDMYQGYLYTLAAIIISGALITLLAFVNLGKLSNFFPSSAIQGMLAAIGIIILAKQFHIMIGNLDASGSPLGLLASIPKSIMEAIRTPERHAAAIAGVFSLLIMIFYSRVRNKYFQLIPAPMWIVFLSVGIAYFYANKLGMDNPISDEYLVSIPDNVFSNFPRPDFSKVLSGDFILAVVSITLIASIESLLSIKAVDKLDPQRRQSNVNKDLKALGLATVISGFLGGLNVVTVIARSSVNVNNNATNRSANFFHAIFLVLFIWLFKDQLENIPFPALAAILVYTGYKLASPAILQKIRDIGKEQVLIFLVTLITTLLTSLIIGIVVGILATFLVHMILTRSVALFFSNIKNNNVTKYLEEDGKQHISVKYFSTFLNFFRLKNVLDGIKPSERVVVDLLECSFVDHTVMENLWDYEQTFDKNGGEFEVIGLDLHSAESSHPFALRRALKYVPFVNAPDVQTKRQKEIGKFVESMGWYFSTENDYHMFFLRHFNYFRTRQVDHLYNKASDKNKVFKLFDVEYSEGAFILEEQLHATMLFINTRNNIPAFTLDKGDFYERMHYLGGYKEIKFKTFRDFARRFTLRGDNLLGIRRFFSDDLILFFESNSYYHIESNGEGGILIMDKERHSGVGEVKALVDFGIRLEAIINQSLILDIKK